MYAYKSTFLLLSLSLFVFLGLASGCSAPVVETVEPISVALTGAPDPKLEGTWKTDAGATYELNGDGTYTLKAVVQNQGQTMNMDTRGRWSVDGDMFLMDDPAGNLVPYTMKLEGNTLKLTLTGSMKKETILRREAE